MNQYVRTARLSELLRTWHHMLETKLMLASHLIQIQILSPWDVLLEELLASFARRVGHVPTSIED